MTRRSVKRAMIAVMLVVGMMAAAVGCGKKSEGAQVAGNSYGSAKEILDVICKKQAPDFPVFGGSFSNPTENEPGEFDLSDKDTMTSTLLIPEEVQGKVTGAATMFHMMNTNTFTGCAIRLDGMGAEDAAAKIKDSFKNNQFMCGIPDKIAIVTSGNDVIYFFGAADLVDAYKEAAVSEVEGAKLYADENY